MDSLLQTSMLQLYSIQAEEDGLQYQAQSPLPVMLIVRSKDSPLGSHCDEIERDLPRKFSKTPGSLQISISGFEILRQKKRETISDSQQICV
jgi:hypothetical protein